MCINLIFHPHCLPPPPPPAEPQELRRIRARAAPGELLPPGESGKTYGSEFWTAVARAQPGRTASECLDGYLASHYTIVARFSAARAVARTPSASRSGPARP